MDLQVEGKVIAVLQQESGTGKTTGREWKKQSFVIETHEQYPKKVVMTAWNDTCNVVPAIGVDVRASIEIDSREWNGKWYPEIRVYKVETAGDIAIQNEVNQQEAAKQKAPVQQTQQQAPVQQQAAETEELPF